MRMEGVRSKKVIGEGENGTCPLHLLRSGTKGRQVIKLFCTSRSATMKHYSEGAGWTGTG